ncbi:RelA/SpoT family protein [Bacteroidia bacterium]|nr:RelA/SpoT family protein [Bacteroidia bacterium]
MTIQEEQEKQEILRLYRSILRGLKYPLPEQDLMMIRKALDVAINAHNGVRRKSGEPYIYHPLEVANIVVHEIGLGTTSVVCALLHDVVEDTELTLTDIRQMFNDTVATIIDGLTKINNINTDSNVSFQAENYKKMLLTISDDPRIIEIKLADRLHNMRTLEFMPESKQVKIASETKILYAPLAYRLGFYSIKNELEDLSMKYLYKDEYKVLFGKIKKYATEWDNTVSKFVNPIKDKLSSSEDFNNKYKIIWRMKSVSSIWRKMQAQDISFDEVMDKLAIRIVINKDYENIEEEKKDCYAIYNTLTGLYRLHFGRTRDWIAQPKNNGYEALHATFFDYEGNTFEVQIRTKRMDDIAERGYAAHWKYKQQHNNSQYQLSGLDLWLEKIREKNEKTLDEETDALSFFDEFQSDELKHEEIVVVTPKGEFKSIPVGSTVLDFAYSIHSELGDFAIGAKVNKTLCPLYHKLKSADKVEIITSKKQKPIEESLDFVITSRAKTLIRRRIEEEKSKFYDQGKRNLQTYLDDMKQEYNSENIKKIISETNSDTEVNLMYRIATEKITESDINNVFEKKNAQNWFQRLLGINNDRSDLQQDKIKEAIEEQLKIKPESLLLDKQQKDIKYERATCCTPIKGEDIIGIIMSNGNIQIHRLNCDTAIGLMARYGNKIIKTKWTDDSQVSFLTGIKIFGYDKQGILNEIVSIISQSLGINMKNVNFETSEGKFEGSITLYITDILHLNALIKEIDKVEGINKVYRMN